MICINCGNQISESNTVCPFCGAPQNAVPVYPGASSATGPSGSAPAQAYIPRQSASMSGGQVAAIVIAIVVSVLHLIFTFILMISLMIYRSERVYQEYGIDAFDDSDSNLYDDDVESFMKDYYGTEDKTAGLHTPLEYTAKLRSFSAGEVTCEYQVTMEECYRGKAALKMLEGARLPKLDTDVEEIYLVRFTVEITGQDSEAIVALPVPKTTAALTGDGNSQIDCYAVYNLNYADNLSLISKGEKATRWMAYVVDKNDEHPKIYWDYVINRVFRSDSPAVTDESQVESGMAIDMSISSQAE